MNKYLEEISLRIRDHLTKQGAASLADHGHGATCAYRGAEGRMCAVGCLIANEHYSTELEDQSADEPVVMEALAKSGITEDAIDLLCEWQNYHDGQDYELWCEREAPDLEHFGPAAFHNHLAGSGEYDD